MTPNGAREIVERYVADLTRALEAIDPLAIERVIATLDRARKRRARIFVIGNGGSAATAAHLCTDMGVGLRRRGHPGFDVQCLSDNAAITTAVANDISYEEVFSAQLEGVITRDDVLMAFSASGDSPNIVRAVACAKRARAEVIGISGFDGGALRRAADVSIHVASPPGAYGLVEDMHLIFNHILTTCCMAEIARSDAQSANTSRPDSERRVQAEPGGWVRLGNRKRDEDPEPPPVSWDAPNT
ncbi:MAG: SIS domain-containing protein [Myxococcota bacterium]|nr:SIS domain-containing protein [Myxococcota bacterium]